MDGIRVLGTTEAWVIIGFVITIFMIKTQSDWLVDRIMDVLTFIQFGVLLAFSIPLFIVIDIIGFTISSFTSYEHESGLAALFEGK